MNQVKAEVGDWLVQKSVEGGRCSGRITKIEGNIATFFDANFWDGFGAYLEADLTDSFVQIQKR